MNAILEIIQIDDKNIIFYEPKNNTMIDGCYTKIIYSEPFFTMDGLYIHFPVMNYFTHKNMMTFPLISTNITFIHYIKNLEHVILNLYLKEFQIHKKINDSLFNQMISGKIKINKENHASYENVSVKTMPIQPIQYSSLPPSLPAQTPVKRIPTVSSMSSISSIRSIPSVPSLSSLPSYYSNINENYSGYRPISPSLSTPHLHVSPPPGFDLELSSCIPEYRKSQIVLKIYGVWENETHVGLTFRFVELFSI
jgi:hypothetical protein